MGWDEIRVSWIRDRQAGGVVTWRIEREGCMDRGK